MKLLCIDTTKQQAILALNNNGKYSVKIIPETKRHSEALLFELEQFLCDNHLTIQDIDTLGCVVGPGSFTGIRIGVATIKAFKYALKSNIVSDDYFSIVASTVKNGYVALKDTNTAVYLSKISRSKSTGIDVANNDEVKDIVKDKVLYLDGSEHLSEVISYNNISMINDFATIMLDYFTKKAEAKKFTDDANFAPVYAQLSQAERNLKD